MWWSLTLSEWCPLLVSEGSAPSLYLECALFISEMHLYLCTDSLSLCSLLLFTCISHVYVFYPLETFSYSLMTLGFQNLHFFLMQNPFMQTFNKKNACMQISHAQGKSLINICMPPPLKPCSLVMCFSHTTLMSTLLKSLLATHNHMKDISRYKSQHAPLGSNTFCIVVAALSELEYFLAASIVLWYEYLHPHPSMSSQKRYWIPSLQTLQKTPCNSANHVLVLLQVSMLLLHAIALPAFTCPWQPQIKKITAPCMGFTRTFLGCP